MEKPKKYSKGRIFSSFSHDYRHAVETMGESEGFGSSRLIYTEMTASEDSCAHKRKCTSLNADSYDNFGVPMQVLPMSKMSQRERKDLVLRLKMELEQVRVLQKKVGSFDIVSSPSTDNRRCSDGKKRPPLESVHQIVEVRSSQGKKRSFGGQNSVCTKKNSSGHVESQVPTVSMSYSNAHLMKECETLLNRLMQHNFGWVFNNPVDVVKLNIPDYFTVIKHPMDLGTVKKRITSGFYSNPMEFSADVRLTFSNAMTYNPPGNDVNFMAKTLSKYFEVRWKAVEKKLPVTTNVDSVNSTEAAPMEGETNSDVSLLQRKKINPKDTMIKPETIRQIMTNQEKHNLSTKLQSLLGELPENIVDFLKEQTCFDGQANEDEIEIDIDALGNETLYKLRELLDDYLHAKQKNQTKAESCEMELLNESGFSNSSIQPCKGNDQVDKVVDIVGSSYPPVAIEKGSTHRNRRCSSSHRSSSESGSYSDSGSAKASVPYSSTKENLDSETNVESKNRSDGVLDVGNQSIKVFGQVELNSHDKSSAVGEEGHRDEESAPSERQVSPEKLYRAALLRNRFADTILKAREKALEKGEKGDPEKLRMEREELERRQREEKARLQAEAKAAEEARRKAEAEAAAEAKRKRELEREAARQALLQMKKTVDINESSQFIQDLEMRFVDGEDCRSNPLEQLGLYMKEDEEEEEPPQSAPEPANDVDEGNLREGSNPLKQVGLYIKADDNDEEDEPSHSTPDPVNNVEDGEID